MGQFQGTHGINRSNVFKQQHNIFCSGFIHKTEHINTFDINKFIFCEKSVEIVKTSFMKIKKILMYAFVILTNALDVVLFDLHRLVNIKLITFSLTLTSRYSAFESFRYYAHGFTAWRRHHWSGCHSDCYCNFHLHEVVSR